MLSQLGQARRGLIGFGVGKDKARIADNSEAGFIGGLGFRDKGLRLSFYG